MRPLSLALASVLTALICAVPWVAGATDTPAASEPATTAKEAAAPAAKESAPATGVTTAPAKAEEPAKTEKKEEAAAPAVPAAPVKVDAPAPVVKAEEPPPATNKEEPAPSKKKDAAARKSEAAAAALAAKPAPAPSNKPAILPLVLTAEDNASIYVGRVWNQIETLARKSGKFDVADATARFDPQGDALRKEKRDCGANALAFGKKKFIDVEEGLGIEYFNRAIACYEESALWEDFSGLSEAIAWRTLVRWSEDQGGTRKEVARLLAMDPNAQFPREFAPPDLQAEVGRAREAAKYETKVSLDVTTSPVSAKIYVDGKFKGIAPMSVRDLNQGEHYVSIVTPGYEVVQQIVRVNTAATLNLTLKPTKSGQAFINFTDAIRREFKTDGERNKLKLLATSTGAQYAVAARVERSAGGVFVEVHRIRVKENCVVQEIELRTTVGANGDFDKVMAEALNPLWGTDRDKLDPPQSCEFNKPPPNPCDSDCKLGRAKVATAIGGGLFLAGGIATGILARSKATDFKSVPQSDAKFAETRASVRNTAIAADVMMGVGIAAGIAWFSMEFGVKHKQAIAIPNSSIDEEKGRPADEKKEEKKVDPDDPFASLVPTPHVPDWFAMPLPGGVSLGVQGSF